MNMQRVLPLNIDVEKLLQGCENANVDNEQIAEYKARREKQLRDARERMAIRLRLCRDSVNAARRAYRCKNLEHMRAMGRAYYWRNHERFIAMQHEHYKANREAICARYREYRVTHGDRIRELERQRYAALTGEQRQQRNAKRKERYYRNLEKERERARINARNYYAAHRDEINAKARARKAAKKAAKAELQPTTE